MELITTQAAANEVLEEVKEKCKELKLSEPQTAGIGAFFLEFLLAHMRLSIEYLDFLALIQQGLKNLDSLEINRDTPATVIHLKSGRGAVFETRNVLSADKETATLVEMFVTANGKIKATN